MTVVREYPRQWKRPEIDRSELAKLWKVEGWSVSKLATHFKCSRWRVREAVALLSQDK